MQLVLVDSYDVKFEVHGGQDHIMTLVVDKDKLDNSTSSLDLKKCKRDQDWNVDNLRDQLTSEILTGVGTPAIELRVNAGSFIEIYLMSLSDGKNIYENLLKSFQEVKISLFLSYASGDDEYLSDFLEVTELEINPETLDCYGTAHTILKKFDRDPDAQMHVKIVADVPDSVCFARDTPFSKRVLEKESFADVIISTANGSETKAHKAFLSVSSPVLEAMLNTDMEESRTGRIDMTDVSEAGVKAFLRYIYCGELKNAEEDVEVAFQVLYAAHKYNVRSLEAKMMKCLTERPNDDFRVGLAFKIYMFTRNIESDSAYTLMGKAVRILKTKLDELELLQEYKDLFLNSSNAKIAMELCREFATSP